MPEYRVPPDGMEIEVDVEMVTPDRAREIISTTAWRNRPINQARVNRYANEMAGGRWKFTGDAVVFNGRDLLNGQHRLQAIIKSGVAVPMLLVSGIPSATFPSMDQGKARTPADVLAIKGRPDSKSLASAVRSVWLIEEHGFPGLAYYNSTITNEQAIQVCERHPKLAESVLFMATLSSIAPIPRGLATALHYALSDNKRKHEADHFFSKYSTGDDLRIGHPVLLLREKLAIGNSKAYKKPAIVYIILRAWTALIGGETLSRIQVDSPLNWERFDDVRPSWAMESELDS